jgi:transposase
VLNTKVWEKACGLTRTVVEGVRVDDADESIIVSVRPNAKARGRCGRCGRRSPGYDQGDGRRRWRALDAGITRVFIEADAPRVRCRTHGPTVVAVPWARHGVGHSRDFDAMAAWLAVRTSKSATCELLRVAWRTISAIVTRVNNDIEERIDRLDGLRRIGIDEISYKRGHRYLTVVVDHDTGRLVWAAPGRDKATLGLFFESLGEERCAAITHVSADGADWIADAVADRCPNAVRCADPFHVVRWATDALDEVRRQAWNTARGAVTRRVAGRASGHAKALKHARYALWKNPENLTRRQHAKLAWVAKTDPRLHRAYLLKEGLRLVFQLPIEEATEALEAWIGWARRCRIPAFIDLQRRIVKHQASILAAIEHGLSNGRIESVNTKIRLITRVAFGFRSPDALIALAMLNLGGHRPVLPGRR